MNLRELISIPVFEEAPLVLDKESLILHLKDMIEEFVRKEDDIEKLSQLLKFMSGKTINTRGEKNYIIRKEDVIHAFEEACKNGMYYCSTDKKMKCRKGPKQKRG